MRTRTAKITAAIAGIGVLLTVLVYVVFWQEIQVGRKEEGKEPAPQIDSGATEVSQQRVAEIEQFIRDYGADFR